MPTSARHCVVLLQNRKDTKYNDFIGKFYHFPKKYSNLLSHPNCEFIYYEPKRGGSGVYFGYGTISRVFVDRREVGCFFAEIAGYRPFSEPVPFEKPDGEPREAGPTYNAQNAVRRIDPEVLDSICLDGGIILNFKADAHLLTVLGEQLIASEQVGILELVKNAYDAGATRCTVRIEDIPSLPPRDSEYQYGEYPGPVIVIRDNGGGMDRYHIEHGWLRPASTIKANVKERLKRERRLAAEKGSLATFNAFVKVLKREQGGRLPLGEKGVGRFATHRLGRNVVIKTKTAKTDYEYVLKIDWDAFEAPNEGAFVDLDSVGVTLTRQPVSREYGPEGSGTEIVIYSGRPEYQLTEETVRTIARTLSKLCSPSRGPDDFEIKFECPQVSDLAETPYSKLFPPIFTLDALVDEKGLADFDLVFKPPRSVPLNSQHTSKKEYPLRQADKDYWSVEKNSKEFKTPKCGAFFLHIDFWYRAGPWIEGPEKKPFIEYLDGYGGISIFRDGLNVFPAEWGSEVDWLELNKRHIRKGDRLSYREMIGNLEIEQTTNLGLIDKTDRQGMIRNEAYRDLSKLVQALIVFVEVEFQAKRERYDDLTAGLIREPKKLGDVSKQSASLLGNLIAKYDIEKDPFQLLLDFGTKEERADRLVNLSRSLKNLQKSLKMMQEVQTLLTEQAGYGLSIAVSVHELAKITANFYYSVSKLLKAKSFEPGELEKLRQSSESLNTELKRLAPLRAVRNEEPKVFGVRSAIDYCHSIFERKLTSSGIAFRETGGGDFKICARFGAIVQVLTNLFDNSCYWLGTKTTGMREIWVQIAPETRSVQVGDSGPGIDEAIRPYLFEPGYSLREPASGLGLYICKHYMRSAGGDIYEASLSDRVNDSSGAQFILDFARVPVAKDSK